MNSENVCFITSGHRYTINKTYINNKKNYLPYDIKTYLFVSAFDKYMHC